MKKPNRQRVFFFLVFLVGLALILFPIVSQVVYYRASRVTNEAFDSKVNQMDTTEIHHRIRLAQAYNQVLIDKDGGSLSLHDPFSEEEKREGLADYARMLEVNEQIGYIEIPKIGEHIPIYAGTGEAVLQKGAGHIQGTSLPVGGTSTHTVITAHRGLPTARLFTDLDKLKNGDLFYVTNLQETLAYEVEGQVVIEPHEIDYLDLKPGEDIATLLTCTPYMINSHRLLVTGRRVPFVQEVMEEAQEPNRLWIYLALGAALVFLWILLVLIRRQRKAQQAKKQRRSRRRRRRG